MYLQEQGEALRKQERLDLLLRGFGKVLVAFSGGVDSTYLLYRAALILGKERVLAVSAAGGLQPAEETAEAKKIAGFLGIKHLVVPYQIFSQEEFLQNTRRRCYFCKRELFRDLREIAAQHQLPVVLEGTNRDDASEYRPGLVAAKEQGIRSPLLEAGLTKLEIRRLSRNGGLPTWDRPASPCLATRFPYGERLDEEKLHRMARAEGYLKERGLTGDLRVRCHGTLARIEVPAKDQSAVLDRREEITVFLKRLGFEYVTLDLQGFCSGRFDRAEIIKGSDVSDPPEI